jgi:putative ABC transport system permease protein
VNATVLHPLPLPHPEQLVSLASRSFSESMELMSWPDFADVRDEANTFQSLAAYRGDQYTLTGIGKPEALQGTTCTANLFAVLGVQPALGRAFAPGEDEPGRNHVVVLTDQLWRTRFAKDPNVLGRTITLSGELFTIIGVAPASLRFPTIQHEAGLFAPMPHGSSDADLRTRRGIRFVQVLGRLKPDISLGQAQSEIDTIQARLASEYPDADAGWRTTATPLSQRFTSKQGPSMLLLLAAVAFVLLIACANVANLLLARATARRREIAIRAALGAGRGRIVRQLLTESTLLGILGGGVGLLLAFFSQQALVALIPQDLPRMAEISIDAPVLVFTAGISIATGLLFGLVPALHAMRLDVNATLKGSERRLSGRRSTARGALLIGEIALAMVLLVGAGLTLRSFARLSSVDPGFNPHDVLTAEVSLSQTRYPDQFTIEAFYRELQAQLRAMPGVQSAAVAEVLPLTRGNIINPFGIIEQPPTEQPLLTNTRFVSPDYFKVMGIRPVRGRTFADADDEPGASPTIVINQTAAGRFWPNENPIGKHVAINTFAEQAYEIIGIVPDVRFASLGEATEVEMYTPFALTPKPMPPGGDRLYVLVRGSNRMMLSAALTSAVEAVDNREALSDIKSMDAYLSDSVSTQRWSSLLLGIFGALSLLLAVVGVYGVISYSVTQRTRELGIRMALGAQRSQVLRMVLGQGLRLTILGVAIGSGGALALTRILASQLPLQTDTPRASTIFLTQAPPVLHGFYGIAATDPPTFVGIALLLTGVAMLACLLPARRATRVDPMTALREDG